MRPDMPTLMLMLLACTDAPTPTASIALTRNKRQRRGRRQSGRTIDSERTRARAQTRTHILLVCTHTRTQYCRKSLGDMSDPGPFGPYLRTKPCTHATATTISIAHHHHSNIIIQMRGHARSPGSLKPQNKRARTRRTRHRDVLPCGRRPPACYMRAWTASAQRIRDA